MNNLDNDDCIKLAYSIDQFAEASSLGRTQIYSEIKKGNLKARKSGKRTIITVTDAVIYLNNLKIIKNKECLS